MTYAVAPPWRKSSTLAPWERRGRYATLEADSYVTPAAPAGSHPLAEPALSAALRARAEAIEVAFGAVEPAVRGIVPRQFEPGFAQSACEELRAALGIDVPPAMLRATWTSPLDARALYARSVLGTFCRLVERGFDRNLAGLAEGDDAEALVHRWGFHAVDVTPCADGRLGGLVDYILRVPPALVASRTPYAGAMFDVEEALRAWETAELRRREEGRSAVVPARYLKIGVYHFSSVDPAHAGCAAHGSDAVRAATALLERLQQFEEAVRRLHGSVAAVATLLVGVDTDTDAIRVHVPDASGRLSLERAVDNAALYEATKNVSREAAKEIVRDAVAACAGVSANDAATEGMRWFCGYLLKNNLGQVDAVRAWHGGSYADRGHTERLIVAGDPMEDVALRNLAFQAQLTTVEEGAADLDVGMKILRERHEAQDLCVPVLVHVRYDRQIPGAHLRAEARARRLREAIFARYARIEPFPDPYVEAFVRGGEGALEAVA